MPAFVPPVTDERSALLAFLDQQRAAVRSTLRGLDEEQAVKTPSASALSLAGLLKHVVRTERRWVVAALAGRPLPGLWPIVDFDADFRLAPGETVQSLLDAYTETARETEEVVSSLLNLDVPCAQEQAAQWSARWVLLHMIEETARHAGHADVIRESLDGSTARDLAV
jgi:uncharacterized damage-inducible protein DinB